MNYISLSHFHNYSQIMRIKRQSISKITFIVCLSVYTCTLSYYYCNIIEFQDHSNYIAYVMFQDRITLFFLDILKSIFCFVYLKSPIYIYMEVVIPVLKNVHIFQIYYNYRNFKKKICQEINFLTIFYLINGTNIHKRRSFLVLYEYGIFSPIVQLTL